MSARAKAPPFLRCEYDIPTVVAIQALARGDASPDQQRGALNFIINQAAATYEPTFQLSGPHDTAFAEGRRFVGLQLVKLTKLNPTALRKANPNEQ